MGKIIALLVVTLFVGFFGFELFSATGLENQYIIAGINIVVMIVFTAAVSLVAAKVLSQNRVGSGMPEMVMCMMATFLAWLVIPLFFFIKAVLYWKNMTAASITFAAAIAIPIIIIIVAGLRPDKDQAGDRHSPYDNDYIEETPDTNMPN